ncbi:hypothetical protein ASF79_10740 [Agreia sp. Leaf335]|uniref:hypothetical protein n=1 Tax=Agreia sp. Leaf335 TaxID=1736340 RepID=UPI0006F4A6E3|nr:hypothetical protein [Agreia sp. Leaf335]KQR20071.1 hypothetical protein ASF79_10740 [Agreia sp. Leaf335]
MDVAGSVLPWFCCAVFLAVVVLVPRQMRGSDRLRDMQLSMDASPGWTVASGVLLLIGAAIAIALGIVFLGTGYAFAWGFFPLAAGKLFIVGFYAYVVRQPWVSFDDDETSDQL